jgi:hypothetical protein
MYIIMSDNVASSCKAAALVIICKLVPMRIRSNPSLSEKLTGVHGW